MNTQVSSDNGSMPVESGQKKRVASDASMMQQGCRLVTTHEFEHQGGHVWLLKQWCYTSTGITFAPLKRYEIQGISDKRAALSDAERHILGSGGHKGQWYGTTPSADRYEVPHPVLGGREPLAEAWRQGYEAASRYAHDREEERRVLARLGIDGGPVPNPPENPYNDRPEWDF